MESEKPHGCWPGLMTNLNQTVETTKSVTFVLTSCGRLDLLKKTIESFLKYNTYPIDRYIMIEDSCDLCVGRELEETYGDRFELIFNEPKLWHIRSVDAAYSRVKTPFIFHCQDDWEFYRSGFIEESLEVLNVDPRILQVWLRERTDTNGHPVEEKAHLTPSGIAYRRMALNYKTAWNGFSFNPGLRRLSDYERIGSYASVGEREAAISQRYKDLGYYATILEHGAVRHIGLGRHTQLHKPKGRSFWTQIRNRLGYIGRSVLGAKSISVIEKVRSGRNKLNDQIK